MPKESAIFATDLRDLVASIGVFLKPFVKTSKIFAEVFVLTPTFFKPAIKLVVSAVTAGSDFMNSVLKSAELSIKAPRDSLTSSVFMPTLTNGMSAGVKFSLRRESAKPSTPSIAPVGSNAALKEFPRVSIGSAVAAAMPVKAVSNSFGKSEIDL